MPPNEQARKNHEELFPGHCQSARKRVPGPACKKAPLESILLFGSVASSFRPGPCFR